jgi:hypothetical protein
MPEPIELGSAIAPQECMLLDDSGHAVVDIPIDVVASMVEEVLNRDLLCASTTEKIFHAAADSLGRRDTPGLGHMH